MPSIRKTFRSMMDAIARDPAPPPVPNIGEQEPEPDFNELHSHMMDHLRNVLDVYHNSLYEEVRKRKEAEAKMRRFKDLYTYYLYQVGKLKDMLENRMAMAQAGGEGSSSTSVPIIDHDAMCGHCHKEMANMVWLPCRHLCVCINCDDKVMACLLCDAHKVTSFEVARTNV